MKVEDIKKIAVMGAGDMGHGIAEVALLSGYKVAMRDIEQRFIEAMDDDFNTPQALARICD